jgi:hypothetical protein
LRIGGKTFSQNGSSAARTDDQDVTAHGRSRTARVQGGVRSEFAV